MKFWNWRHSFHEILIGKTHIVLNLMNTSLDLKYLIFINWIFGKISESILLYSATDNIKWNICCFFNQILWKSNLHKVFLHVLFSGRLSIILSMQPVSLILVFKQFNQFVKCFNIYFTDSKSSINNCRLDCYLYCDYTCPWEWNV